MAGRKKAKVHRGKKGGSFRYHVVGKGPNKGKRVKVYTRKRKKKRS